MRLSQTPNLFYPLTKNPGGGALQKEAASRPAMPPRVASNLTLAWFKPALITATSHKEAWPPLVEVLIGIIACGVPELTFFVWWTFRADASVPLDGFRFIVSAIEAIVAGGAAGAIGRVCWPNAGTASVYRLANTLVWACFGSFIGYFVAGWIIGANSPLSCFLVSLFQSAIMLLGMTYARCGGQNLD